MFFVVAVLARADDISLIKAEVSESARAENLVDPSALVNLLNSQQINGSWPDIAYTSTASAFWGPSTHLNRLLNFAASYNTAGDVYYQNPQVQQAISIGLDYWFSANPQSTNWWWNDLGGPLLLAPTLLLMQSQLTSTQLTKGISKLSPGPVGTGQNRIWYSSLVIQRGLLENSISRVAAGVAGINDTLHITSGDGVQVDGSFYQHGTQLYNGGYGAGFLTDVAKWAFFLRGSAYAFSGSSLVTLRTQILNGNGWMVRNDRYDWNVIGREISRQDFFKKGPAMIKALQQMIAVDNAYRDNYVLILDHMNAGGDGIVGHKHLWRSDYTVQRTAGSMISLKTFSTRTIGGEVINNENLKGFYLPYGATFIYRDGREYDDIFPVWNWLRVPGTTVEQNATPPGIPYPFAGKTTFVGGVTNGSAGMSTFDQNDSRIKVIARKSWFFFNGGFAALGSDIHGTTSNPVFTTINQSLLRTPVQAAVGGGASTVLALGSRTLVNTNWIFHDGVGYVFPTPTSIYIKNAAQSGSWKSINNEYSSATITTDVFQLGIDHGISPSGQSYSYIVLPTDDSATVSAFANANPIEILANTTALQAVKHTDQGLIGASFHQAGSITLAPGCLVTAESPCVALFKTGANSEMIISVASPTGATEVHLTITGKLIGQQAVFDTSTGTTRLTFNLPGDTSAGASITQSYNLTLSPVYADAGPPQEVTDTTNVGQAMAILDASRTLIYNGTPKEWDWRVGDIYLGSGKLLPVVLPVGTHTVSLRVLLDTGHSSVAQTTVMVAPAAQVTPAAVEATTWQDPNLPANTMDHNLATRWSAQGDGQSITYDLGAAKSVNGVRIAFYLGNQRKTFFDVQVSADGINWQLVFSGAGAGLSEALESFGFPTIIARYVRIVGHGNSMSDWNSLTEVAIMSPPAPADADGNGIPDYWERLYFGTTSQMAPEDTDVDGLSNKDEYISGTSPINANDIPRINISPRENGTLALEFLAIAALQSGYTGKNRYYTIETATTLGPDTDWLPLAGCSNIFGDNRSVIKVTLMNETRRFFRLRVRLE